MYIVLLCQSIILSTFIWFQKNSISLKWASGTSEINKYSSFRYTCNSLKSNVQCDKMRFLIVLVECSTIANITNIGLLCLLETDTSLGATILH